MLPTGASSCRGTCLSLNRVQGQENPHVIKWHRNTQRQMSTCTTLGKSEWSLLHSSLRWIHGSFLLLILNYSFLQWYHRLEGPWDLSYTIFGTSCSPIIIENKMLRRRKTLNNTTGDLWIQQRIVVVTQMGLRSQPGAGSPDSRVLGTQWVSRH